MRTSIQGLLLAALLIGFAGTAEAQGAKPLKRCPWDSVVAGTVCMDRYEASVWRVPNPSTTNAGLVKKIRYGRATLEDLNKGGATQLGTSSNDYAPCEKHGQNCTDDIFAVSLLGVTPARFLTWFQAQAACESARKRLPTNAEWQAAVSGTPDAGTDDGGATCNTEALAVSSTGARRLCVSATGAYDMVGNLLEWVEDWRPQSTACGAWSPNVSPTGDSQCLLGARTDDQPAGLERGGNYNIGQAAGPLAIRGGDALSAAFGGLGFRCAR